MDSEISTRRDLVRATNKGPLFLRRKSLGRDLRHRSSAIAYEMYCYLRWAEERTAMTMDEIIVGVMDRALSDYFRRDRSWQSSRGRILADESASDWRRVLAGEALPGDDDLETS
jgi:hypothetical protein